MVLEQYEDFRNREDYEESAEEKVSNLEEECKETNGLVS